MVDSPKRALVFDLNDFYETLTCSIELDVYRAATPVVVTAQNTGMTMKTPKMPY